MRSLNRVQKIFKIIEVITKIIYVFCIIGLVLSVLGTIGVALVGNDSGTWAEINKTAQTKVDFNICICYCLVGIILCASEAVLYYYVKEFYKKELAVGTPFDKTIVTEMRRIAILHIIIPFGASIFAIIVMAIFNVNLAFTGTVDLSAGLVYLVLSFLFDYGADLRQIEIETVKIKDDFLSNDLKAEESPVVVVEPEKTETKNEVLEIKSQEINEMIANEKSIDKVNKTKDKNLVKKEKALKAKSSTTPKKETTKNVASTKKITPSNKGTTKNTMTKKTVTSKANSTQEKEATTPKSTAQKPTTAKTTPKKITAPKATTKEAPKTQKVKTTKDTTKKDKAD